MWSKKGREEGQRETVHATCGPSVFADRNCWGTFCYLFFLLSGYPSIEKRRRGTHARSHLFLSTFLSFFLRPSSFLSLSPSYTLALSFTTVFPSSYSVHTSLFSLLPSRSLFITHVTNGLPLLMFIHLATTNLTTFFFVSSKQDIPSARVCPMFLKLLLSTATSLHAEQGVFSRLAHVSGFYYSRRSFTKLGHQQPTSSSTIHLTLFKISSGHGFSLITWVAYCVVMMFSRTTTVFK